MKNQNNLPRTDFLVRSRCPCCNSQLSSKGKRIASIPPAETLSAAEHGRFLSGYTAHRVFFTYAECRECFSFFCPVYYPEEELRLLYAHQSENMAEAPLAARRRTQEGYARFLMSQSRRGGNFLEIGADIGLMADACAREGDFSRFTLYEPNVEVHKELRDRFEGRDVEVRTRSLEPGDLPQKSVSTAAMVHVLDHLPEPVVALKHIWDVLEPGGVLLIVTHNCQSVLARILGRRWPPFTLQHPHLFSPDGMRRLLGLAGFECVEINRSTNFFPAAYLARAALSVLGWNASFLAGWNAPLVGLGLGNMGVIARRPK